MGKRLFQVLGAAVVGSVLLTSCATESGEQTSGSGEPLVVALELAYPPFETKDSAGTPEGISPDFMRAFAAEYGYELTLENSAFDGLIPMVQTGKADAAMSSMTITEERRESVDFSEPYARAQLAILANAQSGVTSIEDLNEPGRVVAVKTGSTGDVYATKHLPEAEVVRLADESAAVTEVIQGKADGFLYDQLTIYRNQQRNPDATEAVFIPFQDPEFWGIAVAKGNQKLLDQLNEFIEKYREDGGFNQLSEKYLAEEKKAFDDLGFTWFFDLD